MSQKANTILRGYKKRGRCYRKVTRGRVGLYINLTVTAGDCWHIRTMSDFNKQKVNI